MNSIRQTGRTTNMLREVQRQIEAGKLIAVIAANNQEKSTIRHLYEKLGADARKVDFYSASEANSDEVRGMIYDDIFYDHHARECGIHHTLLDSAKRI